MHKLSASNNQDHSRRCCKHDGKQSSESNPKGDSNDYHKLILYNTIIL